MELSGYGSIKTSDDGYILGGYTRSNRTDSYDFWLVKTDNNGVELWNRTFGGNKNDMAYSVQQTSDGGCIMAGVTRSPYSNDCWLVKTDSEGVEMWNRTIVGPNEENSPNSILQSPDGSYIITGKTGSVNSESYDMWVVSTDPDGYVQWELTFGGPVKVMWQCLSCWLLTAAWLWLEIRIGSLKRGLISG